MSHLIDRQYNPSTGVTVEYHANPNGSVTVRQFQDVENHLAANQAAFNSNSSKSRHSMQEGLGREVASIPFSMIPVIKEKTGIDLFTASDAEYKRLLNDVTFSKLRTGHGAL